MSYREVSSTDDFFDIRDVIAEVEATEDEPDELRQELVDLLEEVKGYGGDHQWRGDWYPVTLIHDAHFEDYAREMAEDIGAVQADAEWPAYCIDWERAANDLRIDYSSVDFNGETYWYR